MTSQAADQFDRSSRARLTRHDLGRFPSDSLFDRLGRAVCAAGCLPRKELFEAWEVARRARRLFRGGRVVDLAGGHGLLAHVMLLLDRTSADALVVDPQRPASSARISGALQATWPDLTARVTYLPADLDSVSLRSTDVVLASHACGALTDRVIELSAQAGARLAVLPCCHDLRACDAGDLTGWLGGPLAIDVIRATRLRQVGYRIWTQTIPRAVTAQNRLLLAAPIQRAAQAV